MRIAGGEAEPPQPLQLRMGHHRRNQGFGMAVSAQFRQHEHIGKITEGGAIGNYPRERHLATVEITAEAQRASERPLHRRARDAAAPVSLGEDRKSTRLNS